MNRTLFALSVAARLPHGMFSIAVLIHVHLVIGSYAVAGACTAVLAVSQAVGGPLAGRVVDRRGQSAVLLVTAAGCSVGMLALAATGAADGTWLVVWSALIGACAPPVGACLRALVPGLVHTPEQQRRVYAADAAATEITWVAGPVLTFGLAGRAGTAGALTGTTIILVISVCGFAGCAASRRWRPAVTSTARRAALSSPGLRVLVAALVGVGMLFGATEVAVTALAETLGAPRAAGPLLGLWGLGSLCGGVVAARLSGGARSGRGLAGLLVALGAGHAALAAGTGGWILLAVLITLAGSMIAPILGAAYGLVDQLAPAGTHTEAFAWLATASAVGTAAGAALAGTLVETRGAAVGFLLAGAAALLAAGLIGSRLRVAPPAQPVQRREISWPGRVWARSGRSARATTATTG
jgi:MFS family permease